MKLVEGACKSVSITERDLEEYLGAPRFHPEREALAQRVGVVNGLAWTSVGGELLEVEVNVVPGSGKVELTGNLGNVMKESARAAFTYIRSRAVQLALRPTSIRRRTSTSTSQRGRAQGRPLRRGDHHHRHGLCPHRDPRKGGCGR